MESEQDFPERIAAGRRSLSFTVPAAEQDETYRLVAFGYMDGESGKLYKSEPITIEAPKIEYDEMIESLYCEIDYYGDYHLLGTYSYTIRLGTAPHEGMTPTGPGEMHHLSIYNGRLSDSDNPLIPCMGTYWFDTEQTGSDMALDSVESLMTELVASSDPEEDKELRYHYYEGGSLQISDLGNGKYKLVADMVLDSKKVRIAYSGDVVFNDRQPKWDGPVLEKDVEFICDYASSKQLSDEGVLRFRLNDGGDPFYTNWPDECPNRMWLDFPGQTSATVPTGTFEVNNSWEKGSALAGQFHYIGNGFGENIGTYYFSIDRSYKQTVGYATSGTIIISINDDGHYEIQADLRTNLGYSIKMSYVDTSDLLKD